MVRLTTSTRFYLSVRIAKIDQRTVFVTAMELKTEHSLSFQIIREEGHDKKSRFYQFVNSVFINES